MVKLFFMTANRLVCTNYKGDVSERVITPHYVWYGSTKWHPEPQWLVHAFDEEKKAFRDFAMNSLLPMSVVKAL